MNHLRNKILVILKYCMKNSLTHLAAIAIVSIVFGLIYITVQQLHHSAAKDSHLQITWDISEGLVNRFYEKE